MVEKAKAQRRKARKKLTLNIPTLIKKAYKNKVAKKRESSEGSESVFKQKRDNYHFQFCYGI